jgi:hypothetical protein
MKLLQMPFALLVAVALLKAILKLLHHSLLSSTLNNTTMLLLLLLLLPPGCQPLEVQICTAGCATLSS